MTCAKCARLFHCECLIPELKVKPQLVPTEPSSYFFTLFQTFSLSEAIGTVEYAVKARLPNDSSLLNSFLVDEKLRTRSICHNVLQLHVEVFMLRLNFIIPSHRALKFLFAAAVVSVWFVSSGVFVGTNIGST